MKPAIIKVKFILIFTIFLFSCSGKKEETVRISGNIYHENTSNGISGAKVYLLGANDTYEVLAETTSNNVGQFSFNEQILKSKVSSFALTSISAGIKNLTTNESSFGNDEAFKNALAIDLFIPAHKTLKLTVMNNSSSGWLGVKLLDYESEYEYLFSKEDDGYFQTEYGQILYSNNGDTIVDLPIPTLTQNGEYLSYQMIHSDGSLKYKERTKLIFTGSDSLFKYATFEY